MSSKIKLAIVDDHEIARSGLIKLLAPYDEIEVVFEAGNGQELIEKLQTTSVDVVILDIKMPVLDGLQALKIIRETDKLIKIIMISGHQTKSTVFESFEAKANGYLTKEIKSDELYHAIKSVISVGYYYSDFASKILLMKVIHKNEIIPQETDPTDQFDERQWNVLRLVYNGKKSREIAKELIISKRLVDDIRSSLLKITNTTNTPDLIKWCIQNRTFD